MRIRVFLLFSIILISGLKSFAQHTDKWLFSLLYEQGSPLLKKILDHPETYRYQIVYTRINRDKQNRPRFKTFYVNEDRNNYFNPASTVKLPVALVALEKLNKPNFSGVDKYTTMLTDSAFSGQFRVHEDTSSATGYPSVANYIKRIFLVSDNDAYNRLYEFDGQQLLNEDLWEKGYKDIRITRRFQPMNEEENRHTNPIKFVSGGKVVYEQPAAYSKAKFNFPRQKILIGDAHLDARDVRIEGPMDFTRHNNFPLSDQQQMLKSVMFPASVKKSKRFDLSADDYAFLYKYMCMLPYQSDHPAYDTREFFDSYAKFFLFKADRTPVPDYMHIYSKAGWSYGFLTDNAYIVDLRSNTEFMVAATIYVNSDGVLNDDKYDYDTIGYPFFKEIGEIIYKSELNRPRKYRPDLSYLK